MTDTTSQDTPSAADAAIGFVIGATANVFAVVDGARSPSVLEWVHSCGLPSRSLFQGKLADLMSDTAPHIVQLTPYSSKAVPFLVDGWVDFWGVMFESRLAFDDLRNHLRHFTVVQLPDSEEAYFSFFDPRSLAPFLRCASHAQLRTFLSPILRVAFPVQDDRGIFKTIAATGYADSHESLPRSRRLSFSPTQMETFAAAVRDNLAHHLARLVQQTMPTCVARRPYCDLLPFLKDAITNCNRLGIRTVAGHYRFASLSILAGQPISQFPAVAAYLQASDGAEVETKLMRLSQDISKPRTPSLSPMRLGV